MRIIFLAAATVLTVLYIVLLFRGRDYDEWTENLEAPDFPLSFLYTAGYAWTEIPFARFRGRVRERMMIYARLLYDPQFAEFYSTAYYAAALSFLHLFLAAGFIISGLTGFGFFAFTGFVGGTVFAWFFLTRLQARVEERRIECTSELPEIVTSMALLINSGMILKEAWRTVSLSREGMVYDLMKNASDNIQNGMSEKDAYFRFGVLSGSVEVQRFASALVQGMESGSRDLAELLLKQASEMWSMKRQIMLQKGEQAAGKLLIPTTLIFIGIIVIVIAAALGMLL